MSNNLVQPTPILEAEGIVVRYDGVPALADINLTLHAGEVHALLGENGAGKSTLMKVIAGAVVPDEGEVRVRGVPVSFRSPRDARAVGVRMVHQELRLVPGLSAADNIGLGREPTSWRRGVHPWAFGDLDRRRLRELSGAALNRLGKAGRAVNLDAPVETLSLAARQLVEIAKALASGFETEQESLHRSHILLLDEPTAVLSDRDRVTLFEIVRQLVADGVGVLYTTHRLHEVDELADRVTVLRDGVRVAHGASRGFPRQALIQLMVGRADVGPIPRQSSSRPTARVVRHEPGERVGATAPTLLVNRLVASGVRGVSFEIHQGEIIGLVGLVGAGRSQVARAIIGATPIRGGGLALMGKPYTPRGPVDAVRAGIGYIPEDRAASGLILDASVRTNLTLASVSYLSRFGVVDQRRERSLVLCWIEKLAIRTPSIETKVAHLSGGNQQKVVLARWLARQSSLLIADEPTRGVDVGARAEIYRALRDAAAEGTAVLVITSELEEGLELCSRLIVMRDGQVSGELSGEERSAERVGALMMPVAGSSL